MQSSLPTQPAAPEAKPAPEMSNPSPAAPDIAPGGPTITVMNFVITGNTVYSDAQLQPLLKDFLDRPLTLADLYKAADALSKYYQDHGYGLARATVPQQELKDGSIVTLQVVEGRIGKVSVEGATRTRVAVIEKRASGFKSGDLYTDAAMDRSVLLLNDLPGIQAQAVLQPGSDFGTADLIYKAVEQPEASGNVSVDDYGQSTVGLVRVNTEVDFASLTGSGDRLAANITHSAGNLLDFGGLSYSLPMGPVGGNTTANYNESEYRVAGADFAAAQIRGRSDNAGLSYLYPEIRGRYDNLYLGFGLQHSGSATFTKGLKVNDTNLNVLQLTAYYNHAEDDGTYYSLGGTLSGNGRTNDGAELATGGTFYTRDAERGRLTLDGSYVQPFASVWSILARAGGQWSSEPLVDTEKYSLGGPDSTRAFLSAEKRGDTGISVTVEISRSLDADKTLSAGWFVDGGKVWTKRHLTLQPCTADNKTCYDPGVAFTLADSGFEFNWQAPSKRWFARLQWAIGTGGYRPSNGYKRGQTWLSLGMNFGGAVPSN